MVLNTLSYTCWPFGCLLLSNGSSQDLWQVRLAKVLELSPWKWGCFWSEAGTVCSKTATGCVCVLKAAFLNLGLNLEFKPSYLDPNASTVSSVQSLSRVQLFVTPWTAACQASLSITNSKSPPKPMSIESVIPSNHLILCGHLLLPPSVFPSIRVFFQWEPLDESFHRGTFIHDGC